MDRHDFPPGDEPEVLTGISPACHQDECKKCNGLIQQEPLMFCVHECHRVDPVISNNRICLKVLAELIGRGEC
jgi:hypothetical protein